MKYGIIVKRPKELPCMAKKILRKVYLVIKGKKPGVYQYDENWQEQIAGFSGYIAKGFKSVNSAIDWWRANDTEHAIKENQIRKAFVVRTKINEAYAEEKTKGKRKRNRTKAIPTSVVVPIVPKEEMVQQITEVRRPTLKIYTDGSVKGDESQACGYAGIIVTNNEVKLRIKGRLKIKKRSSCSTELSAIYKVLKHLKKDGWNLNEATIYTDSKYVSDFWIKNVLPKDCNKKLWKKVWKMLLQYNITVYWIKGHAGNQFNEECDKLAKEAAEEQLALVKAKKVNKKEKKTVA